MNTFNGDTIQNERVPLEIAYLGTLLGRYSRGTKSVWLEYGFIWADDRKNYWIFVDNFGLKSPIYAGEFYSANLITAFNAISISDRDRVFSNSSQASVRHTFKEDEVDRIKINLTTYFQIDNLCEESNNVGIFAFYSLDKERYNFNGVCFGDNWISTCSTNSYFKDNGV